MTKKIKTREDFLNAQSSKKVQLAHLEASQIIHDWVDIGGGQFTRQVSYFVVGVLSDGIPATYIYDPLTNLVTIDFDPSTVTTALVYRFFFASHSVRLPWDLDTGTLVDWLPYISTVKGGSSKLDKDNTGVSLEGTASVTLDKDQAFWQPIYEKLYWSNQNAKLYDYNPNLPANQAGLLFKGKISTPKWGKATISFTIKNFIYELRSEVSLPLYSEASRIDPDTGVSYPLTIPESLIGKPVRRLYGLQEGLLATSISKVLTEYKLTELITNPNTSHLEKDWDNPMTFSGTSGTSDITASSSDIYSEAVVGDTLKVLTGAGETISEDSYTISAMNTLKNDNAIGQVTLAWSGTARTLTFSADFQRVPSVGDTIALSRLSNSLNSNGLVGVFRITGVNTATPDAPFITFVSTVSVSGTSPETFDVLETEVTIVRSVLSNVITIDQDISSTFSNLQSRNEPNIPYRRMNRYFQLAEHQISEPTPLITSIAGPTSFQVDSVNGLNINDVIEFSGQQTRILNLSNESKTITTTGALIGMSTGLPITRLAVQDLSINGDTSLRENVDFILMNDSNGSSVKLSTMAERDKANEVDLDTVTFLQDSRAVYSQGKFANVRARDFLKLTGTNDYFEVLEVISSDCVIIDQLYNNSLVTGAPSVRQVKLLSFDIIQDTTNMVTTCYGATVNRLATGPSVLTAPDIVLDLLNETTASDDIDTANFAEQSDLYPHKVSIRIPEQSGKKSPKISIVIGKVNGSVLGSVYYDTNFLIKYKHIDADIGATQIRLDDFDLLSDLNISTDNTNLLTDIELRYNWKEFDPKAEVTEFSQSAEFQSDTTFLGALPKRKTFDSWLLDSDIAQAIVSRIGYQNEKQKNSFSMTTSMRFEDVSIWDIILLKTTGGFDREGLLDSDTSRLCMVNSISKNGNQVVLGLSDLGGILSNSCKIAPNTAPDFDSASADDKLLYGYITDSSGKVETEDDIGTNLIS